MRFIIFIILLFSSSTYAENGYNRILAGMTLNSVTIIGETHKRPEATEFFQTLITSYLQQNRCLTIALEIASSQQSLLDGMIESKAVAIDIKISPAIDHPSFRALLNKIAELRKYNDCLKLIAIDAELELKTNRDEWMAKKLTEQPGQVPILALLGSLHTLKTAELIALKEAILAEQGDRMIGTVERENIMDLIDKNPII